MINFETLLYLFIFVCVLQSVLLLIFFAKRNNKNDKTDNSSFIQKEFSLLRTELNTTFGEFSRTFNIQQDSIRTVVEKKLYDIQVDNEKKLEQMRLTVDEKLHKTLENRLGESFKIVSMQLEAVQKGLGEMQNIATDVGDLKRVLSNVKTKGVLGEYQLASILEEILTPSQYSVNVKTIPNSDANVEFAIKIPSKATGETIWLPLDSKFPTTEYQRLNAAYEVGDKKLVLELTASLAKTIKLFAKSIHTKYVAPPYTTDFAIMFLPMEGLYAEVLRIPGLFEYVQKTYKVTITGPTTISAFLNSLQMGFRTLAIEKRTDEIWKYLYEVRNEFEKFGEILDKTRQKLESATHEIESVQTKSKRIEKKLKSVELE